MKKLFLLLLLVPFIIVMTGCEEDPTEAIGAPNALQLVGATNGVDLVLTWSPSSTVDIDGYKIRFEGTEIWDGTATTYTHVAPTLGEYEIVAYLGSDESDALDHDTEDDVATGTGTIFAYYTTGQSGYGWNLSTGTGAVYSFTTGNAASIDFYYDADDDFTSADVYSGDFPNETGLHASSTSYDALNTVPSTGEASYYNYITPSLNDTYALIVKKDRSYGNFAKIEITAMDGTANSATFRWTFQTIEKWRRID